MLVEKLQIEYIAELAALAQKTYAETFGGDMSLSELNDTLEKTKSVNAFKEFIATGDEFLVAKTNGHIIGYVGLQKPDFDMKGREPTKKDQALKGIYVDPNFHRQGIGKQLMDCAFEQPRFKQAENVYLCVWEENKPAYHFYINYGFKIVGTCDVVAEGKIIGTDQVMMKSNV